MNRVVKDYLMLLGVSGTIIGLDQWTKWLVRTSIPYGEQWLPEWLNWLEPYARFVHWYNKGAAFGMFQQGAMVFTVLAFIVIGAILYYYPRVDITDWPLRLALSLQMAGAAGNLIDRLTLGHVTDFISVGTFPVFNIADASISVGVAVLILGAWYQERKSKQEPKPQTSPEEISQA